MYFTLVVMEIVPKGKIEKVEKIMFQKNHKNDHFRNKYTL